MKEIYEELSSILQERKTNQPKIEELDKQIKQYTDKVFKEYNNKMFGMDKNNLEYKVMERERQEVLAEQLKLDQEKKSLESVTLKRLDSVKNNLENQIKQKEEELEKNENGYLKKAKEGLELLEKGYEEQIDPDVKELMANNIEIYKASVRNLEKRSIDILKELRELRDINEKVSIKKLAELEDLVENKIETKKPEEKKPEENKTEENKTEENKPEENKTEENKPEENKPEENKTEEKKTEEKKPEEKKPEEKKPEEKKPEEKKPEEKKTEEKKTEEKKPEEKKTEEKKPEEKKPEEKKTEEKKTEEKKPEEKKTEEKKTEEKKPEQTKPVQNIYSNKETVSRIVISAFTNNAVVDYEKRNYSQIADLKYGDDLLNDEKYIKVMDSLEYKFDERTIKKMDPTIVNIIKNDKEMLTAYARAIEDNTEMPFELVYDLKDMGQADMLFDEEKKKMSKVARAASLSENVEVSKDGIFTRIKDKFKSLFNKDERKALVEMNKNDAIFDKWDEIAEKYDAKNARQNFAEQYQKDENGNPFVIDYTKVQEAEDSATKAQTNEKTNETTEGKQAKSSNQEGPTPPVEGKDFVL